MSKTRRRWRFRYLFLAIIVLIAGLFSFLGNQIFREVEALRSAPRDNVQWTLAQLEIELLTFLNSVRSAEIRGENDSAALDDTRKRFDIFYSRMSTINEGPVFDTLVTLDDFRPDLERITDALDEAVPTIDGGDRELFAALPALERTFEGLRPTARELSLEGVRIFAKQSDESRRHLGYLLLQSAATGLLLIMALATSLAVLYRQHHLANLRADQIRESHSRYASAIDASLDAIIVADGDGDILDFSPAAENTFGYSRARAIGSEMAELIVPPDLRRAHTEGMKRYLETGNAKLVGAGRFEIDAMHSSGKIFPVEMSIGVSEQSDGKPIFISFVRDISRRREVQRELTSARDQALAADKAKSQFLAVMSHEMRTPLNGVMAILDLLTGTKLDEKQTEFVETAITSGEILQHHIDDVLDITRIEAGAIDLHPTRFEIADLLQEVLRSHELAATERGNSLKFSISTSNTLVAMDRNRLRQILLNLVGNAVKFTDNGTISIIVEAEPDSGPGRLLKFVIEDTGIGIAAENLGRIFDDFVTLDPSYRRGAEGYGLGLAICRRIAAAMGGKISVRSRKGEGSTFTVSLPEAEVPMPETEKAASAETPEASRSRELRVLVVEDNETNRFVARAMLEKESCEVFEAVDGEDGVAKASASRYDLILMDISMPNMDGLEATRRIRDGGGHSSESPIVLLTAHVMREEEDIMRELGVHDHLLKPLRQRNLRKVLDRVDAIPTSRAANVSAADDVLDMAVLNELAMLMPDEKLQNALVKFCAEVANVGEELAQLTQRGEFADAGKRAHQQAGSAAMFGAASLANALRHAQDLAASQDGEALAVQAGDISGLSRSTVNAIRKSRHFRIAEHQ